MKTAWAKTWNASKQARKQRKYRHNAPMHTKVKFLHGHLSKDLRKKYGKRSLSIRKGDKVKVLVGDSKGKEVKVIDVDVKNTRVFLEGIDRTKMDGSKVMFPFQVSNLMITALGKEDKRIKKIKKEIKVEKAEAKQ